MNSPTYKLPTEADAMAEVLQSSRFEGYGTITLLRYSFRGGVNIL